MSYIDLYNNTSVCDGTFKELDDRHRSTNTKKVTITKRPKRTTINKKNLHNTQETGPWYECNPRTSKVLRRRRKGCSLVRPNV